jgi:hypothetical protein
MTHSTPTRLETALGSIVAAWLALSLVFVPVAFQKRGAEAHHTSSHHFQVSPIPSGIRQFARLLLRRTFATCEV